MAKHISESPSIGVLLKIGIYLHVKNILVITKCTFGVTLFFSFSSHAFDAHFSRDTQFVSLKNCERNSKLFHFFSFRSILSGSSATAGCKPTPWLPPSFPVCPRASPAKTPESPPCPDPSHRHPTSHQANQSPSGAGVPNPPLVRTFSNLFHYFYPLNKFFIHLLTYLHSFRRP